MLRTITSFCKPLAYSITLRTSSSLYLNIFLDYDVDIQDAYIETEVDEYGSTYETMYVSIANDSFRICKLLESDLLTLDNLFKIFFDSEFNGVGQYGKIYEFSHYFE